MTLTDRPESRNSPGDLLNRRVNPGGMRSISRGLALWITVLALPLAALLLLAEPDLDLRWEHHPSHFWLVLTVAAVNVTLGVVASEVASRRDDARTFLVSMALLASAGFLGLHALATPSVLLDRHDCGVLGRGARGVAGGRRITERTVEFVAGWLVQRHLPAAGHRRQRLLDLLLAHPETFGQLERRG
jgi:hypothetical protein